MLVATHTDATLSGTPASTHYWRALNFRTQNMIPSVAGRAISITVCPVMILEASPGARTSTHITIAAACCTEESSNLTNHLQDLKDRIIAKTELATEELLKQATQMPPPNATRRSGASNQIPRSNSGTHSYSTSLAWESDHGGKSVKTFVTMTTFCGSQNVPHYVQSFHSIIARTLQ